ncbi:MAG TPA: ABC transporter permease [Dongiaceae bacterium]|nr:ABC transporter permease [Dongiaceae bacterium]
MARAPLPVSLSLQRLVLQNSAALAADQHAALLLSGFHPAPTGDALIGDALVNRQVQLEAWDDSGARGHEAEGDQAAIGSLDRINAAISDWVGRNVGRVLLGLSFPLILFITWQASSLYGWLPDQILPAPSLVWQTLQERIADGSLWDDASISLLRVLRGFTLGATAGLALGGLMAASRKLHDYLNPLFLAVSQVPTLGWVPLLILLVGIDEGLKNILVALSVFIPVTLGTYQGIRDVPHGYREVGQVLTFGRAQMLRIIILPAAVPAIFTGLREGLSNGWQTLVAVELLASTEGLGYQMSYGRQLFQLELVIATMLVIGLIGFVFDFLLGRIENHLQRWKVAA